MKRFFIFLLACVSLTATVAAQSRPACDQLARMVKRTYNFKPSRLTEAQKTEKSKALDGVWQSVKARSAELAPCLRVLLKENDANPFFIFDGSNLLVAIDSSSDAKQFQVENYARTALEDVDPKYWVSVLAQRGSEGFDTSKAALHWLSFKEGQFFLPEHGAYLISHEQAALILFGSMDENFATPALLAVAGNPKHPAREIAVKLLISQATPESLRGLAKLDVTGLSKLTADLRHSLLTEPRLLKPRDQPKTSREQFVRAFEDFLRNKPRTFFDLVAQVPDGEHDVVAVLRAEDIPLLRRVRRQFIRNGTPHAIEFYNSFTEILVTMIWTPELVR